MSRTAETTESIRSASFDGAEFVTWFAEGWRDPDSLDAFCDHFLPRFHDDVLLTQPLARTGAGHAAFRWAFARLFAVIPDLRAEVAAWSADGRHLFIELELGGAIGGRQITWRTTDHLTVEHDLITQRRSYFDPTTIVVAVGTRPWAWPRIAAATWRAFRSSHPNRARART